MVQSISSFRHIFPLQNPSALAGSYRQPMADTSLPEGSAPHPQIPASVGGRGKPRPYGVSIGLHEQCKPTTFAKPISRTISSLHCRGRVSRPALCHKFIISHLVPQNRGGREPPSEREVDFAEQKTEGACATLSFVDKKLECAE